MAYRSRQKYLEYQRTYLTKEANRVRARDRFLQKRYGITSAEYDRLVETQKGVCAICERPNTEKRRLFVDHDHISGKHRGLLCLQCNHGMERVDNVPDWCDKATEYLRKHSS